MPSLMLASGTIASRPTLLKGSSFCNFWINLLRFGLLLIFQELKEFLIVAVSLVRPSEFQSVALLLLLLLKLRYPLLECFRFVQILICVLY